MGRPRFEKFLENDISNRDYNFLINKFGKKLSEIKNKNLGKYLEVNGIYLFMDYNAKVGDRISFFSKYIENVLDIEIINED